jgi:hypothetical protein
MKKKFNLNYSFLVKLTPLGWLRYKEYSELYLPPHMHKPVESYEALADANGYVAIQGWRFLQAFGGDYSALGKATEYYELDILIDKGNLLAAQK